MTLGFCETELHRVYRVSELRASEEPRTEAGAQGCGLTGRPGQVGLLSSLPFSSFSFPSFLFSPLHTPPAVSLSLVLGLERKAKTNVNTASFKSANVSVEVDLHWALSQGH